MIAALSFLAAVEEGVEPSKTPFYIAGGVLVLFALLISAIGVRGAETFPSSKGARTAVCALAALLVAATMATAVITG
jgi:hypothetical protein